MNFIETAISGVWIIEPKVWGDTRGYFVETFKQKVFDEKVGKVNFIQDNESKSSFGVLRGLHYQLGNFAQAKLVRVIQGSVIDVAVDIRKSSSTFGKHVAVELTGENKRQLFVPRGFAHGFVVTSPDATFVYKVDNDYAPQHEKCIIFNDPTLGINWGMISSEIKMSAKDLEGVLLNKAEIFD
jgi:dTDP-4-dehydrorhamnose 3,5-epimerase